MSKTAKKAAEAATAQKQVKAINEGIEITKPLIEQWMTNDLQAALSLLTLVLYNPKVKQLCIDELYEQAKKNQGMPISQIQDALAKQKNGEPVPF